MSVYTVVDDQQLNNWLHRFALADLISATPIQSGTTNSNYLITTTEQRYVVTLFEQLQFDELGYFIDLVNFFEKKGFPCAPPIPDAQGQVLAELAKKPAVLQPFLSGESPQQPTLGQCAVFGEVLAKLHLAGADFAPRRDNPFDQAWFLRTGEQVRTQLSAADTALFTRHWPPQPLPNDLPRGTIHGDLFCDNTLFCGDQLTGIIDFYFACCDSWLLDLAIVINDWCANTQDQIAADRREALLSAYQRVRPLTTAEKAHWPNALRLAALRFWLSRLWAQQHFADQPGVLIKDPGYFAQLLE